MRPAPLRDGLFRGRCVLESLYVLPILLFSVVVHEIAHGWVALRLGDSTARDANRLTLNPVPHIDPIGSIAIPLLSLLTVRSVFVAWARPVPIDPANFRKPGRDSALVSIAGPLSNMALALCCTFAYILLSRLFGKVEIGAADLSAQMAVFLLIMFRQGITQNILLAVFNMIPIPPLDGSHVLMQLLPAEVGARYRQIGFFGIIMVLMLMQFAPVQHALYGIVASLRSPCEHIIISFRQ